MCVCVRGGGTKKPGSNGLFPWCGKGFMSAFSEGVSVAKQALCAIAFFSIYAGLKSKTLAAVPSFGHTKLHVQHTLVAMGSAAIALGKATRIPYKG